MMLQEIPGEGGGFIKLAHPSIHSDAYMVALPL